MYDVSWAKPKYCYMRVVNTGDDKHCDPIVFAGTVRVHFGPPSAVRNRVCQALRIKNIQIQHSAYKDMQSGDDFAPVAGLMPGWENYFHVSKFMI